jgi:hypothetical protein
MSRTLVTTAPISIGWYTKHMIAGFCTGGLWLITGYPLCLRAKRRMSRTTTVELPERHVQVDLPGDVRVLRAGLDVPPGWLAVGVSADSTDILIQYLPRLAEQSMRP